MASRRGRFRHDDRGGVLVFVGLSLALFLGLIALSFDLGRLAVTNSDLQSYADSVALAAAAELDGAPGAIDRARAAAATLIADSQTFGTGDRTLAGAADYTLVFLSGLPASDGTALPDGQATIDPADALFAWVTVTPVEVDQGFARAFRALSGRAHANPQTGATAVAGMTRMACDITPMMFCLPATDWRAEDNAGVMINLRSGGQGAAWGPGDFGFIAPNAALVDPAGPCAGASGAQLYRCLVGATGGLTGCVAQRGVDMEPGQREGLAAPALNTRFDIYTGAMSRFRTDPAYAPAPNVIKGRVRDARRIARGNQCLPNNQGDASPETVRMPRDACIEAGTCRVGDGRFDWSGYLATNYADRGGTAFNPAHRFGPYPGVRPGSRFEMYLAEIEMVYGDPFAATWTGTPVATTPPALRDILRDPDGDGRNFESGTPVCSAAAPARPERRLIVAAGIDCTATPVAGAARDVPVAQFVTMFLTEPATDRTVSPPVLDIHAEVVGPAGGDGTGAGGMGGIFRDVVQIYR